MLESDWACYRGAATAKKIKRLNAMYIIVEKNIISKSPPRQMFSLGICLLTFFSGVASLTGSDSMAGRPSEEQPCEVNRKRKLAACQCTKCREHTIKS